MTSLAMAKLDMRRQSEMESVLRGYCFLIVLHIDDIDTACPVERLRRMNVTCSD